MDTKMVKSSVVALLLIGVCLVRADELDDEVTHQEMRKIVRAMTNQTKADSLNLPSNATSIRENIVDTFSCEGRMYGYYADVDNDCQVFHVCLPSRASSGRNHTYRWSFICPEETVFNQEVLVCTREQDSINCTDSPMYYDVNMEIGKVDNDTDVDYDNDKPIENIRNDGKPVNEVPKEIQSTRRKQNRRGQAQKMVLPKSNKVTKHKTNNMFKHKERVNLINHKKVNMNPTEHKIVKIERENGMVHNIFENKHNFGAMENFGIVNKMNEQNEMDSQQEDIRNVLVQNTQNDMRHEMRRIPEEMNEHFTVDILEPTDVVRFPEQPVNEDGLEAERIITERRNPRSRVTKKIKKSGRGTFKFQADV